MISPVTVDGAVCWRSGMAIDADGDPAAYNPNGGGDDFLADAGKPGHWFGVVTDGEGKPIVQGQYDPYPGDYIASTSLCDKTKALTDPRRYVDSRVIPYVSIPSELLAKNGGPVHVGDVAMVCYGALSCAAIVADVGPKGKYGEGSIALAKALGIPSSPRNGGCSSGVAFSLFTGTARAPAAWPRTVDDFSAQAAALFASWGGAAKLAQVLGDTAALVS